jgi:hypothetical protein
MWQFGKATSMCVFGLCLFPASGDTDAHVVKLA